MMKSSIFDLNDEKSVPNAIERAFLEKRNYPVMLS